MKKPIFYLLSLIVANILNAQVLESCDCTIDTIGYSNFLQTLTPSENAPFQFHAQGNFAVAYGVIDSSTPTVVQDLIDNHPNVTTIIMHSCPGSADDTANLQASQLIYNKGYKMYLPVGGFIASGGTDMFLAGSTRVIDVTPDAVGVHSWSEDENGNVTATDYPVGHIKHQPYIDYYVSIGFTQEEAEAFYYFTINSSPFTSVHWMTQAELNLYKVRTCEYAEDPSYGITVKDDVLKADLDNKTYQWLDCSTNTAILNETNQSFIPSNNGSYAVIVSESNCVDTSACVEISALSIHTINHNLNVYTNSITGTVQLSSIDSWSNLDIDIYDALGKYYTHYQFKNETEVMVDLPSLPGIYFLNIRINNQHTKYKVVRY